VRSFAPDCEVYSNRPPSRSCRTKLRSFFFAQLVQALRTWGAVPLRGGYAPTARPGASHTQVNIKFQQKQHALLACTGPLKEASAVQCDGGMCACGRTPGPARRGWAGYTRNLRQIGLFCLGLYKAQLRAQVLQPEPEKGAVLGARSHICAVPIVTGC
jgi:hypothetical protein